MTGSNSQACRLLDELQRLILVYHTHLLTPAEKAAWNSLMQADKADTRSKMSDELLELAESSPEDRDESVATHIRLSADSRAKACEDPVVEALLERGSDEFYFSVCLRVLRDHADEIELNLCPRCLALCSTPRAKQCRKCFHSWHHETS